MNHFFRFSLLAISLAALFFSGCKTTSKLSTKEFKLRFTPQKGDEYTMSRNMNMLMSGPQNMNINKNIDNGLKYGSNDGATSRGAHNNKRLTVFYNNGRGH